MTRLFVYFLLLDVVFCRCVWLDERHPETTDANHMKHSQLRIDRMVASCLQRTMTFSYSMLHRHLKSCFVKYFSSCIIKTYKFPMSTANNHFRLCGMISISREQDIGNHWITMRVFSTEYVAITIILFDLPWGGRHCHEHGMIIRYFSKDESKIKSRRFCGRRLPWNMLYEHNQVAMKIYRSFVLRQNSRIYLHYWSQFADSLTPFTMIYCERNALSKSPNAVVTLRYVHHRLLIYANVLNKIKILICFRSNTESSADHVNVYDGPGSKSALIFSGFGNKTCEKPMISTGSMFTLLYHQVNGASAVEFLNRLINPTDISGTLSHENTNILSASNPYLNKRTLISIYGADGDGFISKFAGDTSRLRHTFNIKHVIFTGPSNFDTDGSASCQYGGLFIYKQTDDTFFPELEICADHKESDVPIILGESHGWVIATLWYAGYTEGQISGLVQATECTQIILRPQMLHSFKSNLQPYVHCALFYTSGQNSTVTIIIKMINEDILGPADFEIITDLLESNISPVLHSSITCVEADNITKHVRKELVTKPRTVYLFQQSVTLSYCIVHITPLILISNHFFTLKINRHVCKQRENVYAPNIYLDPRIGNCSTTYKNVPLPIFHIIPRSGEAYRVNVRVKDQCQSYPTITVVDARRNMSHIYTVNYGNKQSTGSFLLTRAQIKIERARTADIDCVVGVTVYLYNISHELEADMFVQKWKTKRLTFQSRR